MAWSFSASAWVIVRCLTTALLAAYAARVGRPTSAAAEEMLTIMPRRPRSALGGCLTIARAVAWPIRNVPSALTDITRRQVSNVRSSRSSTCTIPAQFTSTSTRPASAKTWATVASTRPGSVTSHAYGRQVPPADSTAARAGARSDRLRSATHTSNPDAASSAAVAPPIAPPAPVTSATGLGACAPLFSLPAIGRLVPGSARRDHAADGPVERLHAEPQMLLGSVLLPGVGDPPGGRGEQHRGRDDPRHRGRVVQGPGRQHPLPPGELGADLAHHVHEVAREGLGGRPE